MPLIVPEKKIFAVDNSLKKATKNKKETLANGTPINSEFISSFRGYLQPLGDEVQKILPEPLKQTARAYLE